MHEQWQDLIPFYVAGVLPPAEVAALERHLSECPSCRAAFGEWRLIAQAVQAQGEEWSQNVPPLSPLLRANLHLTPRTSTPSQFPVPNYGYSLPTAKTRSYRQVQKRAWGAVTLAAALVIAVVFGGLILYMTGRNQSEQDIAMLVTSYPFTYEPEIIPSQPFGAPNTNQDLGILPVVSATPAAVPSWQTGSALTNTPLPPTTSTITTASDNALSAPSIGTCTAGPSGASQVNIYQRPGTDADIIGILFPGEFMNVFVQSSSGWYELVRADGNIAGWVLAAQVALYGPCDSILLPSPTIAPSLTPIECTIASAISFGVNMHTGPGEAFEVINAFGPNDTVAALAKSDNGWYRVRFIVFSSAWIGWVPQNQVRTSGVCDNLPVLRAQDYVPETTPPLVTPSAIFQSYTGIGQYELMTTVPIGDVPANTRVRISYAMFNGNEWIYSVVTEDEQREFQARESQLAYVSGTPAPNASSN